MASLSKGGGAITLLNEYEAAALIGLSAELLRWLTKHPPKQGIKRTLQIAEEKKGVVYFEQTELVSFNEWLKLPWPHKPDKRPPIPTGIRNEIKTEANGECAICNSHQNSCEAAHIEPVAKSKNNHPENLIWLCSNHHTKYDHGHYGPKKQCEEFVKSFKITLHHHKRTLWQAQGASSSRLYRVLDLCGLLEKQLDQATTTEQVAAVKMVAEKTLKLIPELDAVPKGDHGYNAFQAIAPQFKALRATIDSSQPTVAKLNAATKLKRDYELAAAMVECPLCEASGRYNAYDCPVCGGDKQLERNRAREIDLRSFKMVLCPLCGGAGRHNGHDCPVCGGEKKLERRHAEVIDLSEYELIDCPLCRGTGQRHGSICPECGGEGGCMEKRQAATVDLDAYEEIDCPLCRGRGYRNGDVCPVCQGDRRVEKRVTDATDLREFDDVDCPLCKGKGHWKGEDCPVCKGDRRIERRVADQIELRDYQDVKCPACGGSGQRRGDECRACSGNGYMERRFARDLD